MQKHPETFPQLDNLGTYVPAYRPTFEFRGKFIDSSHKFFAKCPVDGLLIQIRNSRFCRFGSIIEGWLQREDALKLYEIAYFVRGDILELGCFHGLSTTVLAQAIRRSPYEKRIYTVDLNPDNVETAKMNLRMKGLARSVTGICGDATEVVKRFADEGGSFEFVFIDHCHAYEPVYTVCCELHRIVPSGGFCLFHDFNDPRNRDAEHGGFGVYQAVRDGLRTSAFEFYGLYGCSALYRAI